MQDKINGEEIAEENTTDDGVERGPATESAKAPDGSRSYDRVNENGEAFVKLALVVYLDLLDMEDDFNIFVVDAKERFIIGKFAETGLGIMRVKAGAAGSAGSTILDWLNEENSSRNIENSEFEDALTLCREGIQKSHELGRTSLKFSFIKLEKNEVVFKY
ncbi:hypothetical protein SELMODRAFT_417853 [Selaginella moellendorffii]|uniref:Uncharacterized protein n=1 Tax=Selaginella moellendorffii TaxID=88036 RepID=D8S3V1_SELML|nr:hypothetical protein SELMODRAFT_417853 [Selaginella moellendorffii]